MRRTLYLFAAAGLVVLLALSFVSCKGGTGNGSSDTTGMVTTSIGDSLDSEKTTSPELLQTLKDELTRQLEAKYGDYSKTTSSAPSDDSGRVTDLAYDTDTHTLSWTYANLADYDSNGEVGVPDITPIANYYLAVTTDGEGNDALETWIDGDASGDVGVPDITPIANNYLARVDGYRVYRKAPGEVEFSLLPDPDDAGSPLTIPHEDVFPAGSPDTFIPIEYSFGDEVEGDTGIVSYYVAGYDTKDEEESEPSNMINIDLSTGLVNAAPVAKLAVDTDYGGAPLTVTFDASGSMDSDGTIEEYRFDLDGDGIIDYSSDDAAPPTESSGGTVTDITPGASPWHVTATYTQFSSEFYPASVVVVDDKDAESLPILKDIGVTGWEREVIKSSAGNIFDFEVSDISQDPLNGEIVVAGYLLRSQWYVGTPGVYFARRRATNDWDVEFIFDYEENSVWNPDGEYLYGEVLGCKIAWDEDNSPILLLNGRRDYFTSVVQRVFAVRRSDSNVWNFEELPEVTGADGPFTWGEVYRGFIQFEPGRFVAKCYTTLAGEGETDYLLWYDNGVWSVEFMNWHSTDTTNYGYLNGLIVAPDSTLYTSTSSVPDSTNMFMLKRESQGIWNKEYIPGHTEDNQLAFWPENVTLNENGEITFIYSLILGQSWDDIEQHFGFALIESNGLLLIPFPKDYNFISAVFTPFRDGCCTFMSSSSLPEPRFGLFAIYSENRMIYEKPGYPYDSEMRTGCSANKAFVYANGEAHAYLTSGGDWEAYAFRVDPLNGEE